jgi:hypothetical protein
VIRAISPVKIVIFARLIDTRFGAKFSASLFQSLDNPDNMAEMTRL